MRYRIITGAESFDVENVDEFRFDDDFIMMLGVSGDVLAIVSKSEYITILRRD